MLHSTYPRLRRRLLTPAALASCAVALAFGAACGPGPDELSGGDEKRETAAELPLAEPVHDRLAPAEGDATDWKRFEVPVYETDATVYAWWDNPDALVSITMRDQFGGKLYSLEHSLGKRKENWAGIRVRKGRYYLEVHASTGDTVYTLEVRLEEGGPGLDPGSLPPPI